jgi:hypothetical protein
MSDERGDEKGKEPRRAMTQQDRRVRARGLQSGQPLAATSKKQPEASAGAKDNTRSNTTCSRKFEKIRDEKYAP